MSGAQADGGGGHAWALNEVQWSPHDMVARPAPGGGASDACDAPLQPQLLPAPLKVHTPEGSEDAEAPGSARRAAAAAQADRPGSSSPPPVGCQAPGCVNADGMRGAYNKRVRLCGDHVRALTLVINGVESRFCQQCNRVHPLSEFEGVKHTCARMLALHNSRRRERYAARAQQSRSTRPRAAAAAATASASAPPPAPAAPPLDDDDVALHRALALELGLLGADDDGGGDVRADASGHADGESSLAWLAELMAPRPAQLGLPLPLPEYSFCVPSLAPVTLTLKLPHSSPAALPPAGLRAAAVAAFDALFPAPRGPGAATSPLYGLEGTIAPGCTLLLLHALTEPRGLEDAPGAAAAALQAALRAPGAGGAFLRGAREVALATPGGDVARAARGGLAPRRKAAPAPRVPAAAAPLAALASADVALTLTPAAAPTGAAIRATMHGQLLRFHGGRASDGAAAAAETPRLRACGAEGAVLLTFAAAEGDDADADADLLLAAAPPRVLLLSSDAALVAEVAAAGAAAREAGDAARVSQAEAAAAALGHALRRGCTPQLAARAAAAALELGWHHAARRALQAAADAADGKPGALLLPGGASLLHAAAARGSAGACEDVLRLGGAAALFGSVAARSASGATPLHAAAARRDAAAPGVAAALLAGGEHAAAAWLAARDARGVTPSRLAAAGARELAALDASVRADAAAACRAAAAAAYALAAERGVFAPAHRAAAAAALLRAAPSASADAAAHALAAAILRADAESPDAAAIAALSALAASALDDPAMAPDVSYSAWLLMRHEMLSLGWSLLALLYHGVRVRHALTARPLAELMAAQVASPFTHWRQALPLYWAMLGSWHQLIIEVPSLLLLALPMLPGAPRAWRAWLVRHAAAVLLLQHATHIILATVVEAALLAREAGGFLVDGAPPVMWPAQVARYLAWGTLISQMCWPLPGRTAAALLLLRAFLPLTRFWLATPMPGGAIWQFGGAIFTGAIVAWRERTQWPIYRAEMAARRAAAQLKAHAE